MSAPCQHRGCGRDCRHPGRCSPTRADARDAIASRHTARLWRLAADAVTDLANAAPAGRLRDHLKEVAGGLHDTARDIGEGAERL